jgi:hypothetical protein
MRQRFLFHENKRFFAKNGQLEIFQILKIFLDKNLGGVYICAQLAS